MNKRNEPPVEIRVLIEGFAAGLIAGIGIKTGISVDEGGLTLMLFEAACKLTENMKYFSYDCWGTYFLLSIAFILVTVFAILVEITRIDDWRIGAVLYGIGFVIGILIIIFN